MGDPSEIRDEAVNEIAQFNVKAGYIKALKVRPTGGTLVLNGEEYPLAVQPWPGVRPPGLEDGEIEVVPIGRPLRTFDTKAAGGTLLVRVFDHLRFEDGEYTVNPRWNMARCMADGELHRCIPPRCQDSDGDIICPSPNPEGETPFEHKPCDDQGQGYVDWDFALDTLNWLARDENQSRYQNNQQMSIPVLLNNPYIKAMELHAAEFALELGDYVNLRAGPSQTTYTMTYNGPNSWLVLRAGFRWRLLGGLQLRCCRERRRRQDRQGAHALRVRATGW